MSAGLDSPSPETITASVELQIADRRVQANITVPAGPVHLQDMLPIIQSFANTVVDIAVEGTEALGLTISCQKGCGACCRQLVPITEVEARQLRDLVNNLPEPRRTEVRARFAAARQQLESSGLLERLDQRELLQKVERKALGLDYFHQAIPCPFLEEESCSIHQDRPVACREYLVTSPAVNCARPSATAVSCIELPARVSHVLARMAGSTAGRIRWVPLILAPGWADEHPDEQPPRSAPDLLQEFFGLLSAGKQDPGLNQSDCV
jgi:Fe-S-cluster containining protein